MEDAAGQMHQWLWQKASSGQQRLTRPGRGAGTVVGLADSPGSDDSTRMATVWESGLKCGGGGDSRLSLCPPVSHSDTQDHY